MLEMYTMSYYNERKGNPIRQVKVKEFGYKERYNENHYKSNLECFDSRLH